MDGVDITKAVLNKGKQMASVAASAANGNGGKKRRKGTDLKPIVTNDAASPAVEQSATTEGYDPVFLVHPLILLSCSGTLSVIFPFPFPFTYLLFFSLIFESP